MKGIPVAAAILMVGVLGCGSMPPDLVLRDTQVLDPPKISVFLQRVPIGPTEDISSDPLLDSTEFSAHLLQVRTVYERRLHRQHDLTVLVHRGHGHVFIDNRRRSAEPGDVFHIPRGTPYQCLSLGPDPLVAILIFTPPFTPEDAILLPPRARSYPRRGAP